LGDRPDVRHFVKAEIAYQYFPCVAALTKILKSATDLLPTSRKWHGFGFAMLNPDDVSRVGTKRAFADWSVGDAKQSRQSRTCRSCKIFAKSQEVKEGTSTKCAHCGQPFRIKDHHAECWRSSNGNLFCNEFCADDAEEAAFQFKSRAR
jgi:uncharacterized paraquat-inducible protein A